jgi:predicted DNA-binding protein with PD1-like motif
MGGIAMRTCLFTSILILMLICGARAQDGPLPLEYQPYDRSLPSGTAQGMKATELAPSIRTFHIVFSKGDDVAVGLAEFAEKNHLTDAHFEAIGAFGSAVIGWSDRAQHAFKVVKINEEMEVSSFLGSITRDKEGKPLVHAHCTVGLLRNGAVYAGHCLHEEVSLTLQMYLTDSEPLIHP